MFLLSKASVIATLVSNSYCPILMMKVTGDASLPKLTVAKVVIVCREVCFTGKGENCVKDTVRDKKSN